MKRALSVLMISMLATQTLGDVAREGAGARRAGLNAMELKPLDPALLTGLSEWSGESPVTSADTAGKVVLLFTWSSWYSPSHQVLPLAQKLAAQHGSDLVVIGVHHAKGYEKAQALAKSRGVSFPIARDADGAFRAGLMVDQDPDFYVIDRAGQVRYADIATGSVTEAVETLLAESRSESAGLNTRIAAAAAAAEQRFDRTGGINQEVDLRSLPEIPYTEPSANDWEAVKERWPELPQESRRRRGDDEERKVAIPGVPMLPKRPDMKGRAIVLYFWHPFVLRTVDPTLLDMDNLQKRKGRDVAVIGVMIASGERQRRGEENEFDDPERLNDAFSDTFRKYRLNHTIAMDLSGETYDNAFGGSRRGGRDRFGTRQNRRDASARPLRAPVVVLSSDGTLRWFGDSNDLEFTAALDRVLQLDPGVRARRRAEAEYIRTQRK